MRDGRTLRDLAEFARLEVASADIEPWAATLAAMRRPEVVGAAALDREAAYWAVKLYNSTDDIGSTFRIMAEAPSLRAWVNRDPLTTAVAREVPLSGERRNLRGGKLLRRLDSYASLVGEQRQAAWVAEAIHAGYDRAANFTALMPYLSRVWGVGRLSAFEWCEFLHKVDGVPVETTDGCLWQSSGPRESIERLYNGGAPAPSTSWLNDRAAECRDMLAHAGVALSWWDFETVICDFNVMRKGRYYPGKHLAMLSEEIAGLPDPWRGPLETAYRSVIPAPWCDLPPGVDKGLCRTYVRTGLIRTPLETA